MVCDVHTEGLLTHLLNPAGGRGEKTDWEWFPPMYFLLKRLQLASCQAIWFGLILLAVDFGVEYLLGCPLLVDYIYSHSSSLRSTATAHTPSPSPLTTHLTHTFTPWTFSPHRVLVHSSSKSNLCRSPYLSWPEPGVTVHNGPDTYSLFTTSSEPVSDSVPWLFWLLAEALTSLKIKKDPLGPCFALLRYFGLKVIVY